ncbi:MAG: hypothetical protein PF795_14475 [Kiritimatiellae bacterium]|jgi:hypothetical protein|nr:hypothetical protein [Kiritimatiellia bacterium]
MRTFNTHLKTALSLLACLGIATSASAALLAYDGFDSYAEGALAGNNGGSGWLSDWESNTVTADVQSGGLSYSNGSVIINGGSKAITIFGADTNNEQAILRQFTPTTSNGDLYFSYLVQSNTADVDDFYRIIADSQATWVKSESGSTALAPGHSGRIPQSQGALLSNIVWSVFS